MITRSLNLAVITFVAAVLSFAEPAESAAPPASPPDGVRDDLPPHAISRLGQTHFRQQASTESLDWSSDGKCIASGDHEGTLRLWDARTGQLLDTPVKRSGA